MAATLARRNPGMTTGDVSVGGGGGGVGRLHVVFLSLSHVVCAGFVWLYAGTEHLQLQEQSVLNRDHHTTSSCELATPPYSNY